MSKRKTYTSSEVKNRWNKKSYDRVQIVVPKGARDEVHELAKARGMSVNAYIRALMIEDANRQGKAALLLRGGVQSRPGEANEPTRSADNRA